MFTRYWTYSLSDSSLATAFSTFFVTKLLSLPSKLRKPLWSTTTCMYKHTFCLSSTKCWFCSLVSIVKCAHCRQYNLTRLSVANNTNTWDHIVGNGHILQWDLMRVEKKSMFIHTHSSAPNMFAKFGWKNRTFYHKKWEKQLPYSSQTDYSMQILEDKWTKKQTL